MLKNIVSPVANKHTRQRTPCVTCNVQRTASGTRKQGQCSGYNIPKDNHQQDIPAVMASSLRNSLQGGVNDTSQRIFFIIIINQLLYFQPFTKFQNSRPLINITHAVVPSTNHFAIRDCTNPKTTLIIV